MVHHIVGLGGGRGKRRGGGRRGEERRGEGRGGEGRGGEGRGGEGRGGEGRGGERRGEERGGEGRGGEGRRGEERRGEERRGEERRTKVQGNGEGWQVKLNLCAELETTVMRVEDSEHSKQCRSNQTLPYHWHCAILKVILGPLPLSRTSSSPHALRHTTTYVLLLPTNFKHTSKSRSRTNRRSSTSVGVAIFILSLRETIFLLLYCTNKLRLQQRTGIFGMRKYSFLTRSQTVASSLGTRLKLCTWSNVSLVPRPSSTDNAGEEREKEPGRRGREKREGERPKKRW